MRVEAPRTVEWRTPGLAAYGLARDFEERYPAAYAAELDAFAACVLDGTPPRCTGRDALAASDLATACDESWRSGSTSVIGTADGRDGPSRVAAPLAGQKGH